MCHLLSIQTLPFYKCTPRRTLFPQIKNKPSYFTIFPHLSYILRNAITLLTFTHDVSLNGFV